MPPRSSAVSMNCATRGTSKPTRTGTTFAHRVTAPAGMHLLRNNGSLWITIDDNESYYLKVLCDEVFGRGNFVANIVWQKRTSRENRAAIGSSHDHILLYTKHGAVEWKDIRNRLPPNERGYSNPDNDIRGPWRSIPFSAQGFRKNQMYKIRTPSGVDVDPPKGRCWAATEPEYVRLLKEHRVYFPNDGSGKPRIKQFKGEEKGLVPMTWWDACYVPHYLTRAVLD